MAEGYGNLVIVVILVMKGRSFLVKISAGNDDFYKAAAMVTVKSEPTEEYRIAREMLSTRTP